MRDRKTLIEIVRERKKRDREIKKDGKRKKDIDRNKERDVCQSVYDRWKVLLQQPNYKMHF